ncbi:MAG: hypothetical protein ACRC6T_00490 [Sarcina sp.]
MDYLKELLYELAYELDFYIEAEDECRKALYYMAKINEQNYSVEDNIYSEDDFWALKKHINETFQK